jgi:hypothetical protein
MLAAARLLNSALDRVAGDCKSNLNAVIPNKFAGGGGRLAWMPVRVSPNRPVVYYIESNEDLEEQFHWIFGPYVLDDYVEELESMLHDVVHGDKSSYVCSTVRMEVLRTSAMLQIQQIFIRPCLQRHGVLGKILLYLARRVTDATISVAGCLPESSAAIKNRYGGDDPAVFEQTVDGASGLITFTMVNPHAFVERFAPLDDIAYPSYHDLNGCEISDMDCKWAQFARFVHYEEVGDGLVFLQFKEGYYDDADDCYMSIDNFRSDCFSCIDDLKQAYDKKYTPDDQEKWDEYDWAIWFVEELVGADEIPKSVLFITTNH